MEIFQTIWNALISENEFFIKLNAIPSIFLEACLYMLMFLTLLKIECTKKQQIIFVVVFSIISIFNTFFGIAPYNNLVNVLAMPVLVLLIFKTSVLKAVLSQVIVFIIVVLVSTISITIYSTILQVPSSASLTVPIHKICISLLLYLGLYTIYKLCKKFNINISLLDKLKKRITFLLVLNFAIGTIAIGTEYYLLFKYIDFMPNALVFFSLFVLSLYFGISLYSLLRTNKLEITAQSLEDQKMYNKTLNTLYDNIRGFKHDFNNIVQAIGGYLSADNLEGLRAYYKDLLEECQINNNLAVLNPELINNPAIYSLLADKYYKAEKASIKLNLEVMADLSNLNIKVYELSRILGVLLDNSLEAAAKCENKLVNVIFRNDKKHNKVLIIIQNTYINKDINIDRIFEKGYSSKKDDTSNQKHGLGLWEIKKYLEKNTNLDLYTTKNDEFFTQQFEIYN